MEIEGINTRLLTRGPLKVKVIRVEFPTYFWVQPENGRDDLDELVEDLTRRMKRKGSLLHFMGPDHVLLDEAVAVREGRRWQRGIEIRIERGDVVTVALRDWGRIILIFDIYILEDRFHELPWQAIPCGLAHIQPVDSQLKWPRRVNDITKLLIEKREGWIQIRGSLKDEAVIVTFEPKRDSEDELRDLKEMLVQMGCAQHSNTKITAAAPSIFFFL